MHLETQAALPPSINYTAATPIAPRNAPPLPLPVVIRPSTQQDTAAVATIQYASFYDMSIFVHVMPGQSRYPTLYPRYIAQMHRLIRLDPSYHLFLALDPVSRDPVGYALWRAENSAPVPDSWVKNESLWTRTVERALLKVENLYWNTFLDGWSNPGPLAEMYDQYSAILKDWIGEGTGKLRPHFYLRHCCVKPEWQGRGIGPQLVRHGLRAAKEMGVDAALLSTSPIADAAYEKVEFRTIGEVVLGSGTESETRSSVMVWDKS